MLTPNAFGLSDRGLVRAVNQDAFVIDPELGLFLVADGMGGAQAGDTASRVAVDTVVESLRASSGEEAVLAEAYEAAHTRVCELAGSDPQYRGMGTTLVGLRVSGDVLELASVGDSRAYVYSGGELQRLTRDQSWVEEVGKPLGLSDEELRQHRYRHVITMAIGIEGPLRVAFFTFTPSAGSRILLCTDGLHGPVPEETVKELLAGERELSACAHSLIKAAIEAGAPDNVTVLLVDF